ncbi:MAG: isoprenylcysteine carboxylmethyltransferase family protein [Planctomycetota bacterium]
MTSLGPLDIPAAVTFLIVGFYWYRVVRMVRKQKKQTGRAGNFVPRETIGRILRVIWYPTVIIWIVAPGMAMWTRSLPGLQLFYDLPILRYLAVVVAGVALWLTMICWREMGKSWRMGIDPDEKTELVVQGAFGYVRHPIYALQMLLAIVSFLGVPTVAMAVVATLLLVFLSWEAIREERYLVRTHGDAYGTYYANVGRFVPRSVRPYKQGS